MLENPELIKLLTSSVLLELLFASATNGLLLREASIKARITQFMSPSSSLYSSVYSYNYSAIVRIFF